MPYLQIDPGLSILLKKNSYKAYIVIRECDCNWVTFKLPNHPTLNLLAPTKLASLGISKVNMLRDLGYNSWLVTSKILLIGSP